MDYQAVLREVESWPVDERVRLVQEVWDRLPEQGVDAEMTEELKVELDRRIEEMGRNPEVGIPWGVVRARVLERFQG